MASSIATLIAVEKPALYRGAVYVGWNQGVLAEYRDFSGTNRNSTHRLDIPVLKTTDEIFAEAKNQYGPGHFCGSDGVIAKPHSQRSDILIVLSSPEMAKRRLDEYWTEDDSDGYWDCDERREIEDAMFAKGDAHRELCFRRVHHAEIDAEWARRAEASRVISEALDAACEAIAGSLVMNGHQDAWLAMDESIRIPSKALRLEIAEKVNEASRHQHMMAQIKAKTPKH